MYCPVCKTRMVAICHTEQVKFNPATGYNEVVRSGMYEKVDGDDEIGCCEYHDASRCPQCGKYIRHRK